MLSGGLPPITTSVVTAPTLSGLQPGQTYGAWVRASNDGLVAQIGTVQIPLPEDAALVAGQRVSILVRATSGGLQFEITPQPLNTPGSVAGPGLEALLKPILQALGKLDLAPRAATLLPQQLPAGATTLQPLLATLFAAEAPGQDLAYLQQVLSAASNAGVIPANLAAVVAQWIGLAPASAMDSWRAVIERARAERAVTARLARSLGAKGDTAPQGAARDSASGLARQLLNVESFTGWLRDQGELESFKALAQRLQERAQGAELQNLRSLDQPYQFLDLPLRESDGFLRAHLHTFSDSGGNARGQRESVHRTILDLETTHLGPLWIAVQSSGGHCACRFRATSPAIVDLVNAESRGLAEALSSAGYGNVSVTAELWDGDRDEALVQLFAPYQRLDLEG